MDHDLSATDNALESFPFACPKCKKLFEGTPDKEGKKAKCTDSNQGPRRGLILGIVGGIGGLVLLLCCGGVGVLFWMITQAAISSAGNGRTPYCGGVWAGGYDSLGNVCKRDEFTGATGIQTSNDCRMSQGVG
jgi:hypothetical protein